MTTMEAALTKAGLVKPPPPRHEGHHCRECRRRKKKGGLCTRWGKHTRKQDPACKYIDFKGEQK